MTHSYGWKECTILLCWVIIGLTFLSRREEIVRQINNVDAFRYHKAHLTRRLILDTSADSEMEENMVEWLRVILPEFAYDKSFLPKLKIH